MTVPHHRDPANRVIRSDLGFDFAKIGATRFDLRDPYHMALTVRWPAFVAGVFAVYALVTSVFAGLYLAQSGCVANARPGSVWDAIFFSLETLATVGYGEMTPATFYGHLVSSAEIVTGMASTAIMTGLIFVRFSKAKAKLVYSDVVVITHHNGRPTLMLRVGNARMSALTQVKVGLNVLLLERTEEGGGDRRLQELPVTNPTIPVFPFLLTIMHEIDDRSPLAGLDTQGLQVSDIRLVFSLEARDPGLSAMVYDIRIYTGADLRLGKRFVDAVSEHRDGYILADLTRISQIEADALT